MPLPVADDNGVGVAEFRPSWPGLSTTLRWSGEHDQYPVKTLWLYRADAVRHHP